MNEKRDNIYIYLWEEFNTIYIGRTINPKSRHYTHRHRESEKTYQFSAEHGVEHPKMVIIENNLSIKEGVEREKYWIEHYKNNTDYDVLNVTCGGQKGRQIERISEEEKKKHRKEYYQKNREKILEYRKKYVENHKEDIATYKKKYYKNNKNKIYEYQKKYVEEHREEKKEYKRLYDELHKDKIKKYYQDNKDRFCLYQKKYRESHKNNNI